MVDGGDRGFISKNAAANMKSTPNIIGPAHLATSLDSTGTKNNILINTTEAGGTNHHIKVMNHSESKRHKEIVSS